MLTPIVFIIVSLGVLFLGANLLVKGAASVAERLGVTPLIVGLTIVAFGTSTPELLVSIQGATEGLGGISIGNAIGSNIVNIGLILGLSALIFPLKAQMQLIRFDTPVMIASALLFTLFFLDHRISRIEGGIFTLSVIGYTIFNIFKARKENKSSVLKEYEESVPKISRHWALDMLFILAGLAALIFGSDFLVKNSVELARMIGMSEAVIGLTILAIGTSTPELATSVVAAIRKQPDIAIGNIVGSNIFNILCILGLASLIRPIEAAAIGLTDNLVMIGLSLLLLPFIKTGFTLRRWEGAMLLMIYIGYTCYLLFWNVY